jgi:site-specific DNA recombinase
MMVQMLGVFAEFERATIVERVIAGMERKAARGEWTGGALPFGYRLDDDRRHLEPEPAEAAIVREIFERYAERLEGAQTIGRWLSERGYRTKNDKPFNPQAVLTILRNHAYLGEIFFRGSNHPAPHEPLIDRGLFERAQGDPAEARRRSLASPLQHLRLPAHWARQVRPLRQALHRPTANGNGGRYRYYVCFTRQRYGRKACDAQSLPADELDAAILDQLAELLAREDDIRTEIEKAFAELDADKPKRQIEIERLDAELRKTNDTLDRYFRAFEHGTMPERACAPRIAKLTQRLSELDARRAELAASDDDQLEPLSDDDLHLLQAHVAEVIADGDPPGRKALLQALVQEIRIVSRDEIYPFFNLPAVRPPYGSVRPAPCEPSRTRSSTRRQRGQKLGKSWASRSQ